MKIEFVKMGINGEGIGYLDGIPVFCDGVLPLETAEVDITERKEHYCKARLIKVLIPSSQRIKDFLSEEEQCTGASLALLNEEAQLACKKQLLEEALWKYAGVKRTLVREVHASLKSDHYRSACKLPVREIRGKLVTGMFLPGSNRFIPLNHHKDHTEELESARIAVLNVLNRHQFSAYSADGRRGLRYLVMRSIQGNHQLCLVTGNDTISGELRNDLMKIHGMISVTQSINTRRKPLNAIGTSPKLLAGEKYLPVTINGLQLQLTMESFFQLNVEQASALYEMAVSKIDPCGFLVEAYCGVGCMSLLAHKKTNEVLGIESVADAVDDAVRNAEKNHITNVRFLCADAADGIRSLKGIDCILVDPPRSGLSDEMLQAMIASKAKRIVYISCNPATLGKNLKELKHHYQVRTVIPFDMFPHTPHVESVTVLERG